MIDAMSEWLAMWAISAGADASEDFNFQPMSAPMIEVGHLSKSFVSGRGRRQQRIAAVSDVSFTAPDGQITALLGKSVSVAATGKAMALAVATDMDATKLNALGTAIQKASYVGTPNYDQVFFVEVDRNNQIFLFKESYHRIYSN